MCWWPRGPTRGSAASVSSVCYANATRLTSSSNILCPLSALEPRLRRALPCPQDNTHVLLLCFACSHSGHHAQGVEAGGEAGSHGIERHPSCSRLPDEPGRRGKVPLTSHLGRLLQLQLQLRRSTHAHSRARLPGVK